MPTYEIQAPDGNKYRIDGPAGATDDQVRAEVLKQHPNAGTAGARAAAAPQTYDPTEGMSGTQKFLAGAGKSFVDLSRGVRQAAANVGLGDKQKIQAEIDEAQRRDQPLMQSGAAKAGNITAGILQTLPAAAIPGVNTMAGAAALGGGIGALQPTATGESRLANTATGVVSGAAGKALGDVAASGLGFIADKFGRIRPAGPATEASSIMAQGYKLPPSYAEVMGAKPSRLSKWAEGFAGKIKTEQTFSKENQANTNRLVRQSLGLGDGFNITADELTALRDKAGQTYEAVKQFKGPITADQTFKKALDNIERSQVKVSSTQRGGLLDSPEIVRDLVSKLHGDYNPEEAIEVVKKLRTDGRSEVKAADSITRELGKARLKAADAIDGLIERNLAKAPDAKGLFNAYRESRKLIAMTYDVQKALNTGTGNVSAIKLARNLTRTEQAGRRSPLSGGIRQAAEFGQKAPGIAREIEQRGSRSGPEHSPLDFAASLMHPKIAAGMLARPIARHALKTPSAQRAMLSAPPTLEQRYLPAAGELIGAQLPPTYGRQ